MACAESIVEAGIDGLSKALADGSLTSVDLVAKYLVRICVYDRGNADVAFNSVPLLNEHVFDEAAAADDRRKSGQQCDLLCGIPYTVKDSYKVKGMTVANGSEAFKNLVANEDAFVVSTLRNAGAVLLGKTNMCPMAYGGMLRGVYGRAESPYNLKYLPAAFGSGSSNGAGVSVAASFAAFGLGGETVSSGRSPASNNGLVAYAPSRGLLSVRGTWPLYPTCDVLVPITRTMDDLLIVLDTIRLEDGITVGDFWRDQLYTTVASSWFGLPRPSSLKDHDHLHGKRVAVPVMYSIATKNGPFVARDVSDLFDQARVDLESMGATVEYIDDFPIIDAYERSLSGRSNSTSNDDLQLPDDWNSTERGLFIARAWEQFLQNNRDPELSSLSQVQASHLFPQLPRDNVQVKYTEPANAIHWTKLAEYAQVSDSTSWSTNGNLYSIPHLKNAVKTLEALRKQYFEGWLDEHNFDYVVLPAAGDVAQADADITDDAARHAWTNGVKYSHGNRTLRHLGIPSVTIPMGMLDRESGPMPMGLTLLGRAYDDEKILSAGYAIEQKTRRRVAPPLTPTLPTDDIEHGRSKRSAASSARPKIIIDKILIGPTDNKQHDSVRVLIEGHLTASTHAGDGGLADPQVEIWVDGLRVEAESVILNKADASTSDSDDTRFVCQCKTSQVVERDARNQVKGKIVRDSTVVMVLARDGPDGWPAGFLKVIHVSEQTP